MLQFKGLQKPKRLECDLSTLTNTYGEFSAEPFERGFGATIGNSLRRALLSSIQGSAVTAVKIEGALHEFSSLSGVIEDVTEIILNIKELRIKCHVDRPKTVTIQKVGPKEITAGDIDHDADVEILNPDLHIADLDKDGILNMELFVKQGIGYVPAERNKDEGQPVGVIPIDAIFSPVRKVNFQIVNTRLGQSTEFEKLMIQVWTDGSLAPADAIAQAAKILKDHYSTFINFEDKEEEVEKPEEEVKTKEEPKFNENLLKSVDELELSVRAYNCLKNANIRTIGELVQRTESEMLKTKNFGRKSLNSIKGILADMGLHLGMKLDNFPPVEIKKEEKLEKVEDVEDVQDVQDVEDVEEPLDIEEPEEIEENEVQP